MLIIVSLVLIHLLWLIRDVYECLEGSKCVFHLNYEIHSSTSYLFHKVSPPKLRPTYSSLVGPRQVCCLKY
jgi:hypothetical protein